MTAAEMRERAKLIQKYGSLTLDTGDSDDDFEKLYVSHSETEDDLAELSGSPVTCHEKINKLIYNHSDDEDYGTPLHVTKTNNKEKLELHSETENAIANDAEINAEDIRSKLSELLDSDDSDAVHSEGSATLRGNTKGVKRTRLHAFESDSDNDENTIKSNGSKQRSVFALKKKKATIIESDEE